MGPLKRREIAVVVSLLFLFVSNLQTAICHHSDKDSFLNFTDLIFSVSDCVKFFLCFSKFFLEFNRLKQRKELLKSRNNFLDFQTLRTMLNFAIDLWYFYLLKSNRNITFAKLFYTLLNFNKKQLRFIKLKLNNNKYRLWI